MNNESITEFQELSNNIDINNISFDDLEKILIGFLEDILLPRLKEKGSIDNKVLMESSQFLTSATDFIYNKISVEQLEEARVNTWKLHDVLPEGSIEQNLLRLVIYTLYDAKSAEYETFGSEMLLEGVFDTLSDLGIGYCKMFKDYIEQYFQTNNQV